MLLNPRDPAVTPDRAGAGVWSITRAITRRRDRARQQSVEVSSNWLLLVVAMATMLAPLNSTMIAVALPDLAREFGVGIRESGWLVTGYLIAMAVVQPIGGRLGDMMGRRRLMLLSLAAFLVASAGAVVAPSFGALVVFRMSQALAGALALPNGVALVREWLPDDKRGAAYGLVGGAAGLAAGLGPPLGGLIVGAGGWRTIFAVSVPVALAALAIGWVVLPRIARPRAGGGFDFVGSALLAGGLGSLALAASSLRGGGAIAPLPVLVALTVALAIAFAIRETRATGPVVRLSLFRIPAFGAAAAAVALGNLAMYTTLLAIPQYLTMEKRPSGEVGLTLAALSVPMALLSPLGGRLSDRWGRRRVALAGAALTLVALLPLVWLGAGLGGWMLALPLAFAGCGLALQAPAVQASAVEAVPAAEAGMASGVFSTSRYLGSIVGSAALAALLGGAGAALGSAQLVFGMVVVAAAGALVGVWLLPRR
jgi:EmrB/QacA subfamily drug resistance transporter